MSSRPTCPYCDKKAKLVKGTDIYPHRADLAALNFWRCEPCKAHIGCHPPARRGKGGIGDGTVPLGRLANYELRRARSRAHALFDPLWKSKRMTRAEAYNWLALQLGLRPANTHIGMFDIDGCKAVIAAVENFRSAN